VSAGDAVRDLGQGVYQLPTDYPEVCNAPLFTYLVDAGGKFALIDPGVTSTMAATLTAAVDHLGLRIDQADLVLATHGHPDHSGGQGSWERAVPGARIAAPLEDVPWVESFDRQWTRFWDDYPGTLDLTDARAGLAQLCVPEPRVDVLLRDGDTVTVADRELTVVETRGHTWGHCAFFDPASGALFTGDAAAGHGTASSDGTDVFAPLYVDVAEARAGLRRLADVPFTVLCPAHVPAMPRAEGLAFLADSLTFIDEAERCARALVTEHRASPLRTSDLARQLAAMVGTDPPLTPQTVATARAHLYALAREGLLEAAWLPAEKSGGGRDAQ
jgi:glyoxylase-like metal-dependent hydrolase (beta-lactamase superfamily II)